MIAAELLPKPKPGKRHWYAYDVLLDGEVIVSDFRDPECDLARTLLARNIKGMVTLLDGKTGRPRTQIIIEKAAKLYVSEEDRDGLRYRKYIEHPGSEAPTGESPIQGPPTAPHVSPACTATNSSFPQKNSNAGQSDHGGSQVEAA